MHSVQPNVFRCQAKKEKAELPKDLLGMIESRPSPDSLKQIVSKRRKKVVAKTFNKVNCEYW